jgi:hypothetical protein
MIFDDSVPPQDALDFLDKVIVPSPLTSSEWQDVPAELRARAFFSSRVESAQFLQQAHDQIQSFMDNNRDENGALITGGRAKFANDMQQFLAENGILREGGGLTDITSAPRLGLIFNTQVQQAFDYGYRKQGMDADVLNEFPAQRFIRVKAVHEPRLNHAQFQGQVFLKTDPIWYLVINLDFGVPWGPWGWGCGHDVEDVDREETEEMGLVQAGDVLQPDTKWNFNSGLGASIKNLDPDLVAKLESVFGDRITIDGNTMKWVTLVKTEPAPAPATTENESPVSDAINVKVHGALADQVNMALKAIDDVHDDGDLPDIDVKPTTQSALGLLRLTATPNGTGTDFMAVKVNGPWPALTTAHEVGHFLDLEAIGEKGSFATLSGNADMQRVLAAADKSDAIQALRNRLLATTSSENSRYLSYLLKPQEIWARAYAQFIAEQSDYPALKAQLSDSMAGEKNRQWGTADFGPVSAAIEAMFKNLGWL